jgi:hypothetical protein
MNRSHCGEYSLLLLKGKTHNQKLLVFLPDLFNRYHAFYRFDLTAFPAQSNTQCDSAR